MRSLSKDAWNNVTVQSRVSMTQGFWQSLGAQIFYKGTLCLEPLGVEGAELLCVLLQRNDFITLQTYNLLA